MAGRRGYRAVLVSSYWDTDGVSIVDGACTLLIQEITFLLS